MKALLFIAVQDDGIRTFPPPSGLIAHPAHASGSRLGSTTVNRSSVLLEIPWVLSEWVLVNRLSTYLVLSEA